MKRSSIVVLVTLACVGLIFAAVTSILHDGLSARATPNRFEQWLARYAWNLAIPANARAIRNPVANTPENLHDALMHFADHCSVCHGNDGSGDALFGKGLYPKPPDLRLAETQQRTDGELFWIIENGVRFTGMPGFASHGMEGESWKLVHFIRHLPQLTTEERIEMTENNPKSPADREEDKQEEEFLNGGAPGKRPEAPRKQP
jgi:mono/diheme cytochrome c family protein